MKFLDAAVPCDPPAQLEDIVVTAPSQGVAIGAPAPLAQWSADEIGRYGIGSVRDLVRRLAPSAAAAAGVAAHAGPLLLLNGRRVADRSEVDEIPSEAIARIDVLSASVAVRYGESPDRPVMNFVLKPRLRTNTGDGSLGTGLASGGGSYGASLGAFRLADERRFNATVAVGGTALTYGPPPNAIDRSNERTILAPHSETASLKLSAATDLAGFAFTTFGATFDTKRAIEPLRGQVGPSAHQVSVNRSLHLGATAAKQVGRWRLSLSTGFDRTDSETRQVGIDAGPVWTNTRTSVLSASFLGAGPLGGLLAGGATGSLALNTSQTWLDTRSSALVSTPGASDDRRWSGRLGLALPVRQGGQHGIGSLTQTVSFTMEGGTGSQTQWRRHLKVCSPDNDFPDISRTSATQRVLAAP